MNPTGQFQTARETLRGQTSTCPRCGAKATKPTVKGGVWDFWTCPKCGWGWDTEKGVIE